MTEASSSYRTILRSSSIMGAASVLNILAGLAKMKVAAVLLGPAGVGLIGFYQNLMGTAATVSALGVGNVGTRQIAAAQAEGGAEAVGLTRRALFWGTMILALLGGLVFWIASGWMAEHLLLEPQRAGEVALLALGVVLSVTAGSQGALLTGLRRIGDVARVQISSGFASAVLGIVALFVWGANGLLALVLVAPLVTFLMGHFYVARLDPPEGSAPSLGDIMTEWRGLVGLGIPFMLSGLVTTVGLLAGRTLVQRELGADALGQFQASWSIGMTYLGFVLGAMGTDYYPRLTAVIKDHAAATRMVNEQTEVALVLCGPALLIMLAAAPFVVHLLYSDAFTPTIGILRWQLLGDMLKVMSWPLGYVILASGAGKTFVLTETSGIAVFVSGIGLAAPLIGITATGLSFLAMYVWYLPLVYVLARRRIGFRWSEAVIRQAVSLAAAAVLVAGLAHVSETLALGVGLPLAFGFGLYGVGYLGRMAELTGTLGRLSAASRKLLGFVGVKA